MITTQTLTNEYADLAWANGEKALQVARWPYIKDRLAQLETAENLYADGITAAVLAILKSTKK